MMFTSADRNINAEVSNAAFRAAIDSAVGGVTATAAGVDDAGIFFETEECVCTEVVAPTLLVEATTTSGVVGEAMGIMIGMRETVVLPEKTEIKMPSARAATMPRYGEKRDTIYTLT